MRHLTILVPEGDINLSSIVGSFKIFTRANQYWESKGNEPVFKIQLAGFSEEVTLYGGLFSVFPSPIEDIWQTNLIVIPSINKSYDDSISRNTKLVSWIRDRYKEGAEIASICTGAFLLASTGIMKHRVCSTHWVAADDFEKRFPDVELITDRIITSGNGIYTNGGAFSFLNLLLYLVDKFYDRKTAVYCSKVFQIDIDRDRQTVFTIFQGQKNHADEQIKEAQQRIENDYFERLSFAEVAKEFAMSRRNFDRRFISATGNTPVEYQQRVRVEMAKKMLEQDRKTINEIMFDVGYSDAKAFREVFRKFAGLSPLEYRKKFAVNTIP